MIVRCGRCRSELQVPGPGEFVCPACGTRNAVRDPGGGGAPAGAGDLGGLTIPGGMPPASGPPPGPDPSVRWAECPSCSYRFAMGEVERVRCPNCEAEAEVTPEGLRAVPGS